MDSKKRGLSLVQAYKITTVGVCVLGTFISIQQILDIYPLFDAFYLDGFFFNKTLTTIHHFQKTTSGRHSI